MNPDNIERNAPAKQERVGGAFDEFPVGSKLRVRTSVGEQLFEGVLTEPVVYGSTIGLGAHKLPTKGKIKEVTPITREEWESKRGFLTGEAEPFADSELYKVIWVPEDVRLGTYEAESRWGELWVEVFSPERKA